MQRFAVLFEQLDTTHATRAKLDAMLDYFAAVPPEDAAWAAYILMGRRVKRSVGPALLRAWLAEESRLPSWLVAETYASVGDLAETIALLVAGETNAAPPLPLHRWFEERILPLGRSNPGTQRADVVGWWRQLAYRECFLVNKLLTGGMRIGVSRALLARALSELSGKTRAHIERTLMGDWAPSGEFWHAMIAGEGARHDAHPYPFFLASPLEGEVSALGAREDWLAEWKWDGVRCQIVKRAANCTLWSRGEEIITASFPEVAQAATALPDGTVIDGELLAWRDDRALPFASLQRRVGRQKVSKKALLETPVVFIAYDLLEHAGADLRANPLHERRRRLAALLRPPLRLSPALAAASWDELAALRSTARARSVEGIMLKRWESDYGVGRRRGAWWKWKIEPHSFDGVLLYAAPGHGQRSNLYSDYTFGVWEQGALVPVAKAYSGLTSAEIGKLDRWIRAHTLEKFGIVRSVEPVQVFELAYEGIAASSRHKSGVALRFPRILRWRQDKPATQADNLSHLRDVLNDGAAMGKLTYEIVQHDGGWAYRANGTYSERFKTHDEARAAAERAASEQRVRGESTSISWEDAEGHWHDEVASGDDRPETDVQG